MEDVLAESGLLEEIHPAWSFGSSAPIGSTVLGRLVELAKALGSD